MAVSAFAFKDAEKYDFASIQPSEKSERFKDYLWRRIYRVSVIRNHDLRFNPEVAYVEDNTFCTLLNPYISTRAVWNEKIAVFYRLRQGSLSNASTDKRISSYIAASADMLQLAKSKTIKDVSCYKNMYLWMSIIMTYAASLPENQCHEILKRVKEKGVFPLKLRMKYRPHSARSDYGLKKKVRAFLREISYTRIGFFFLRILFGYKEARN